MLHLYQGGINAAEVRKTLESALIVAIFSGWKFLGIVCICNHLSTHT